MLLSLSSACWKITDFDFTLEGESKKMYATQNARGTECYRAPELVKDSQVCKKSDIWALGCIIHVLVTGRTAFSADLAVWNYAAGDQTLRCRSVVQHGDPRTRRYISQLLANMLEVDWQLRPNAGDVLDLLRSLQDDKREIYILDDSANFQPQSVFFSKSSGAWNNISWKRCWLTPDGIMFSS